MTSNNGNANIEIRNNGSGTPYLDFSNDTGVDFDVRLILAGDNQLNVEGGTLVQTSDRRLKENIQPLKSSLENLSQLTGYSYNFKAGVFGNDTNRYSCAAPHYERTRGSYRVEIDIKAAQGHTGVCSYKWHAALDGW